jgi:AbrB family looped-hinge helix DNA binding protein
MASVTTIRSKGQITIPRPIRQALGVEEGDQVEFDVTPDGTVTLRGMKLVPADQAWFWTPEWQAGEREADADIAAGRTEYFDSDEAFLAALDGDTE